MLNAGGVATGLAIDVLESQFVGFGGVAPIMVRLADGTVRVINGVGPWPAAADIGRVPQQIQRPDPRRHPAHLHPRRAGQLDRGLAPLGDHVFRRRRRGGDPLRTRRFPDISVFQRDHRPRSATEIARYPSTAAIFLPNGAPRRSDRSSNRSISRERCNSWLMPSVPPWDGKPASRRRMTRSIAAISRPRSRYIKNRMAAGSAMTIWRRFTDQGRAYRCRTTFHDFDLFGCGAWSQGPMLLEALNILEGIDLAALGHNSTAYVHALTEALKLAAADREAYFGDPDFEDVPLKVLLSKDYATVRRGLIDPAKAWHGLPPAGCVNGVSPPPWQPDPSAGRGRKSHRTSRRHRFLCVADKAGNVFAPRPVTGRSADRSCRGPGFCRRCGVRAVIPAHCTPDASAQAGGRACRPIRRSRCATAHWSCHSVPLAARCWVRRCCRCSSIRRCSAWTRKAPPRHRGSPVFRGQNRHCRTTTVRASFASKRISRA